MLTGQKVILRAVTRADLERLCQFNNDVEVEVASGGDPPTPRAKRSEVWSKRDR